MVLEHLFYFCCLFAEPFNKSFTFLKIKKDKLYAKSEIIFILTLVFTLAVRTIVPAFLRVGFLALGAFGFVVFFFSAFTSAVYKK